MFSIGYRMGVSLVDLFRAYFGRISDPWHKIIAMQHQSELEKLKAVSISSGSLFNGLGFSHSFGAILYMIQNDEFTKDYSKEKFMDDKHL